MEDKSSILKVKHYSGKLIAHCSLPARRSPGGLITQDGFTLIETIMVMVIIAILAVAIVVRNPFDSIKLSSATRKVAGDIRYAQKLAISTQQRCGLIRNSNTSYTVFEQDNTADPASSPGDICSTAPDGADVDTTDDFIVDTSQSRCSNYSDVTFTFTTLPPNNPIYFNSLGAPVDSGGTAIGGPQTITLSHPSAGTQDITVTAGTGRVSY